MSSSPPQGLRADPAHLTDPHACPASARRPSSAHPSRPPPHQRIGLLFILQSLAQRPFSRSPFHGVSLHLPHTQMGASQPQPCPPSCSGTTLGTVLCECRFQQPHSGYGESRSRSSAGIWGPPRSPGLGEQPGSVSVTHSDWEVLFGPGDLLTQANVCVPPVLQAQPGSC